MDTKARPAYMLLTRDPLQAKGYIQPENEGMENDVWCKWKFLKSQSSNTHIDKIEFKIKTVRRDKKGHYIMINGSIQEENTVTINISSVQFSLSVVSDSLRPHESQHVYSILSCSYAGCIYIYNCYVFFLDWSFDHYVVSFFVSFTAFILKSILSDMSIATPAFFWSLFAWNISFQPFTFSLYASLVLRWVFCRQHI